MGFEIIGFDIGLELTGLDMGVDIEREVTGFDCCMEGELILGIDTIGLDCFAALII